MKHVIRELLQFLEKEGVSEFGNRWSMYSFDLVDFNQKTASWSFQVDEDEWVDIDVTENEHGLYDVRWYRRFGEDLHTEKDLNIESLKKWLVDMFEFC